MNIVVDYNVVLAPEYREALYPLIPKGLEPLHLDPMDGLKGTPNAKEGFLLITALPTDILNYHGKLFETYKDAPQWFVILVNESDYGIMQLNEARMKYGLNNFKAYFAPDLDRFADIVGQIASEKMRVSGKALICSKHKNSDLETLGQFLFGDHKARYDTQSLTEEVETDASMLLLCGERKNDFQNLKIPEGMEPYYIVLKPEMHVQQYLKPDGLILFLASEYGMTTERVARRLFFISLQYEILKKERSVEAGMKDREILVWDSFGLPLARKDYTSKTVSAFLEKNYTDGERLKKLFA